MSSTTDATSKPSEPFDYWSMPMQVDRGVGWGKVRSYGEVFQDVDGVYYLTSPTAISYATKHPEVFASGPAFAFLGSPVPLVPLAIDPPDHRRFRKVLDPLLAPRVVNALENTLRHQIADLVARVAATGRCDVMADIARLYPTSVFLTLFGMPLDDRETFIEWVETVNGGTPGTEPTPEVAEAGAQLFGYLQRHIDLKRADPGDDMLSKVLTLTGDEAWTDAEVLGMCFLFTLAGLDTVTAEIGFMMAYLAADPELRRRVVADHDAATIFLEEIVRLEPPAPTTVRVTTADTEVCGVRIPAGSMCQIAWGAANRSPERGEGADAVNVDAPDEGHLGFGAGIHRCVGSHLARKELRLVLEEFHKQIPDYRLADGYAPRMVFPSITYHYAELPLVFDVPAH
jgi:cytochrome P450